MRYVLQRLLQFVIVFVIVTFVVMVFTRIGSRDPIRDLAGGAVGEAQIEEVEADYPYLDKPLVQQYVYWLGDFVTGDLGRSYLQSQEGIDMFKQRLPATIFIALLGDRDRPADRGAGRRLQRLPDATGSSIGSSSVTSFGVISMPPLVVGVALLYLVVARPRVLPDRRCFQLRRAVGQPDRALQELLHPALTLGIGLGAVWSRFLRADMILTLQSDFIMLAKAKGVSPNRVLWVHALRASVLSLITSVALQTAALIGGAVIAETFFGPKGIGERLVFAIQQNDILIIQAITAVLVVGVVIVNLVVDLLYAVIDPRIRHARQLG